MESAMAAAWKCVSESCGLLDPRSIEDLSKFEGVVGVVRKQIGSNHYLVDFKDRGGDVLLPGSCLVKETSFVLEKEKLSVFDFCKDASLPGSTENMSIKHVLVAYVVSFSN
jgi:hypothetical protein